MGALRNILRFAAPTGAGSGFPGLLGLMFLSDLGAPFPVPDDLYLLAIGEQSASGRVPLWLAVLALEAIAVASTAGLFLAARGPGRALIRRWGRFVGLHPARLDAAQDLFRRRGAPALILGRTTPGLRTATVVAAATSGGRLRDVLAPLALGSSIYLQAHLALGYAIGPSVHVALDRARGPILAAVIGVTLVVGILRYVRKRRRGPVDADQPTSWREGVCPGCLAVAAAVNRRWPGVRRQRDMPRVCGGWGRPMTTAVVPPSPMGSRVEAGTTLCRGSDCGREFVERDGESQERVSGFDAVVGIRRTDVFSVRHEFDYDV